MKIQRIIRYSVQVINAAHDFAIALDTPKNHKRFDVGMQRHNEAIEALILNLRLVWGFVQPTVEDAIATIETKTEEIVESVKTESPKYIEIVRFWLALPQITPVRNRQLLAPPQIAVGGLQVLNESLLYPGLAQ